MGGSRYPTMLRACKRAIDPHARSLRGGSVCRHTSLDGEGEATQDYLSSFPPRIAPTEQILSTICAFYDPTVYAYCIFDAPTMLEAARKDGWLLTREDARRLLISPAALVRNPHLMQRIMGDQRFAALEQVLSALLADHEATHLSLGRCVASSLAEPNEPLVHFLRGIALAAAARHPVAAQGTYVFDAVLHEGLVGDCLSLPGGIQDRAVSLCQSAMAAAREFGCDALLSTAIVLAHCAGLGVDYEMAKQITACHVRVEKRRLDWSFKGSSDAKLRRRDGWLPL